MIFSPACRTAAELGRPLGAVGIAVAFSILLTSCQTTSPNEATGSLAMATSGQGEAYRRRSAEDWGERSRATAADTEAAIYYAQSLRANGQRSQAVAVLEQASIHKPKHMGVLGAYGRALADIGNFQQALDVLNRAHTPDQPDWRILSVQGAVLDQMGRHADAQRHYASALRLMPDEPSVLSNLGLSYALSKKLKEAEATLRLAAAQRGAEPKVRQNLALVVGLQGSFQAAEAIAKGDLSPDEAAANVAYLRQMLAQQSDWKKGKRGSPLVPTTGS